MRMRSATVFARSKISNLSSISCSLFPGPYSLFVAAGTTIRRQVGSLRETTILFRNRICIVNTIQ